ncbi:MAG: hypothetical protein ABI267_07210 [Ginsengibacter sp.]
MKKLFKTRMLLVIFMLFVSLALENCNAKTKSLCEINKENSTKENNLPPQEKCSSDIFPSPGLNIKI